MYFNFFLMKIDQIEGDVSRFEVPGSKWNFLLPGTSLFLPPGDVCGEIKHENNLLTNMLLVRPCR